LALVSVGPRAVHRRRAVLLSGHDPRLAQYDRVSGCPAPAELLLCCESPADCRCRSLSCRWMASICAWCDWSTGPLVSCCGGGGATGPAATRPAPFFSLSPSPPLP